MQHILRPLSLFPRLREFYAHLDLETTPRAVPIADYRNAPYKYGPVDDFIGILGDLARILARNLSPSLEMIFLWTPDETGPYWVPFRVSKEAGGLIGEASIAQQALRPLFAEQVWGV